MMRNPNKLYLADLTMGDQPYEGTPVNIVAAKSIFDAADYFAGMLMGEELTRHDPIDSREQIRLFEIPRADEVGVIAFDGMTQESFPMQDIAKSIKDGRVTFPEIEKMRPRKTPYDDGLLVYAISVFTNKGLDENDDTLRLVVAGSFEQAEEIYMTEIYGAHRDQHIAHEGDLIRSYALEIPSDQQVIAWTAFANTVVSLAEAEDRMRLRDRENSEDFGM